MNIGPIQIEINERARTARLKEAVLASFYEPAPSIEARLREFTPSDWQRAKYWLDVSGLALYFLDRLETLNIQSNIPEAFLFQLRTNLAENRARTASLFHEAVTITDTLRQRNIECALLKGVTLPPESVPDLSLRNQMDLDLLIRESDARRVQSCLSKFGYSLNAISGNTWEFKAGSPGKPSLKDLYQVRRERAVEIHLMPDYRLRDLKRDSLARAEWRLINGHSLPSLSSADLLILQGQHLFKHMCGELTRASWVLEYWRNVCSRRDDAAFWREVESLAAVESGSCVAIGAATLLTSGIFGPFAPGELTHWSMDVLPAGVCLWVHLYGRRILLSDRVGSKLYLLLRRELNPQSAREKAARRRLLLPLHLPPRITRANGNESFVNRVRRFWLQVHFTARRLRFHVAEGAGLVAESLRWQRRNGGVSQ
jgi:hypothetical protein